MRQILMLSCALLLLTPLSLADEHGEPGPDEHVVVLAEVEVEGERHYLVEDHGALQLWKETNGVETHGVPAQLGGAPTGLQTAWFCLLDEGIVYIHDEQDCAEGVKTAPDTRITNGALLELIEETLPEPVHDLVHEIEHTIEETLP